LEEWFDYYNPLDINFGDGFDFFGFLDPSMGKKKTSDTSAIITLGKHLKTGYLFIMDADICRRHPHQIIEDVLQKEKWLRTTFGRGYRKFGCEINQFQDLLKDDLAVASAKANIYLPIEGVNQVSDKIGRIETLQPDIKNKYIKFNPKHKTLLDQMEHITRNEKKGKNDGPDAVEGCRTLAKGGSFLDPLLAGLLRGVKIWR
jgi:predicted phage terminase large subunit-like protein